MTPDLELQRCKVAALKGDAPLSAFIGDRVYDRAPQRVQFPYVSIGSIQTLPDDAECVNAFEVFMDIQVFSRAYGSVECRGIMSAIYDVMHEVEFTMNGVSPVEVRLRSSQTFSEPDGETTRGLMTFRALIEQA